MPESNIGIDDVGFRALAAALPQMVWVSAGQGGAQYFSPKWVAFTGRSEAELLGDGFLDLVHPDDRQTLAGRRSDVHKGKVEVVPPVEFRLLRHDGQYRLMEGNMEYIRGADGEIERMVGGLVDVTDQRAEDALSRERSEQLRAALEVTGLGRYAYYPKSQSLVGDQRVSDIVGMSAEELMSNHGLDGFIAMIHPDDAQAVTDGIAQALAGGPDYDVEYRIHRPVGDGQTEVRWIAARGRVDFTSRPRRMVGVIEDITDRRAEDEARLQFQKREAIGTLASGVAHDFNNVISAILSNAVLGQAELVAGESPETSLVEIARGARRAGDLVRHLLAFSREEEPTSTEFDLGDVVEEACALMVPTLAPDVRFSHSVARPLPPVVGDATQLHQVTMNLVANAAHAVGANGSVWVSVGSEVVEPSGTGDSHLLAPGHYVTVSVRDDGVGMPESLQQRVFDPFFTTKPAGEGTGLGLTAARRIAHNHGGDIAIVSEVAVGTTATVSIPAASDPSMGNGERAPVGGSAAEPPAPAPSGTRVYFVDDELALVRLADRALPMRGYATTAFDDPRDALAAIVDDPAALDVLVTDFSMPGLSGLELIAQVRSVRPDLPVVLSSGLLTGESRRHAEELEVDKIVSKPCSLDELAAAIDVVVAASR